MTLQERIYEVHNIPLKLIIEAYGGTFLNNKQFIHPSFGVEKTPSGFIYQKNGIEYFKHFKNNIGGDAIDFVSMVTGVDKMESINKILGKDFNFTINAADNRERLVQEQKEKDDKERKRMFAILKNSIPLIDSNIGVEYFQKRGIEKATLTLQDKNIDIRVNSFQAKDGREINNIVYFFNGDQKKGTHKFMLIKGIDEKGNKNGVKLNLMTCRPVIHCSEHNKPFIICEGIEDALSAKELGYKNFISLNSTSSVNKLITTMNKCRKWFTKNSFEVCLDNDKTGIEAMKKIMTFANLVSMYESKNLDNLKTYLKNKIYCCDDNKILKSCKYTLKLLNETKDMKEVDSNIAIILVNNLIRLISSDYFKDYGSTFKIKNSDNFDMIKKLGRNDLNEFLVKDYKLGLQEVLNDINGIEISLEEVAR